MLNFSIPTTSVTLPGLDASGKDALDTASNAQERSAFKNVSGLSFETEVVDFVQEVAAPRDPGTGVVSHAGPVDGSQVDRAGAGRQPWNLPAPDSPHIIAILIGL